MSDAPERIWANFRNWRNPHEGHCYKHDDLGGSEYVRADIVDALVAAAYEAAAQWAEAHHAAKGSNPEALLDCAGDIRALTPADAIDALRSPPADVGWQPIDTAPKDDLIDIWLSDGLRWCDCYHDRITDTWRTSRPSGRLVSVQSQFVTHWMRRPESPRALAETTKGDDPSTET